METKYKYFVKEPSASDLEIFLGKEIYKLYFIINKKILSFYMPTLEIWDDAGRKGRYFHGYRNDTKSFFIDLYLSSSEKGGQVNFESKMQKKSFEQILKFRQTYSVEIQKSIVATTDINKSFGGYYFSIIIDNEDILKDVLEIIELIS